MKNLFVIICLIISFESFSQQLEPTNELALVTVTITKADGTPSVGDLVKFKSKTNGKVYSGESDTKGMFKILLPKEKFFVLIQGFETDDTNNELVIPKVEGLINFTYTIRYDMPKVFTLENVNFDVNKTTIRPESYESLNNIVELMKRKKTMQIEFSGHTDNVGDDVANQKLSEGRAQSVKNYIVSKGIAASRITVIGYGESKPIATNETEEGRQKNRRTEVRIIKE